jgi:adenylate cyclase
MRSLRTAAAFQAERHLMAVLAGDIAGYSCLIDLDEVGTVNQYRTLRQQVIEPIAARWDAALIRHAGDRILTAFACPVSAIECAIAIQRGVRDFELDVPGDHRTHLRTGINMDHVLIVENDLHGKGVNVAARRRSQALERFMFRRPRSRLPAIGCNEPSGRWGRGNSRK